METKRPVRVMLADDHAVVLTGLKSLLEDAEDISVVAACSTVHEAMAQARALRPDIVLMDIRFGPEGDVCGIDACREIRSELAETQVIMFTSYSQREAVLASIVAGASAYLTKNIGPRQIVEAIHAVHRGDALLDASVTRDVMQRLTELSHDTPGASEGLSEREKDVLRLVAEGLTNKEIAARLYLSPFTARNHVIHILTKLGLSRRSEAAAYAARLGLTEQSRPGSKNE